MQIQILSTAALMGLGRVLPFGDHPEGNSLSRTFYPEDQSLQFRAQKELLIDYESGMSLLILYEKDPLVFYLDRTVQLSPGVPFTIVPLGESCMARITLQPGDTLEF